MSYTRSLIVAVLISQAAATALAGERSNLRGALGAVSGTRDMGRGGRLLDTPIDRVAAAVDGAESSHGRDFAMWRPDPSGPQGPMQVSEAAATDVGGGDRFDVMQNRAIGRAYLAQLYWRYKNWPDAVAAYNWGIGNMDSWVKAGRPSDKFLTGVAVYMWRVLHESGLCNGSEVTLIRQPSEGRTGSGNDGPAAASQPAQRPPDSLVYAACSPADPSGGAPDLSGGPSRFFKKLDQAMLLAIQHASRRP